MYQLDNENTNCIKKIEGGLTWWIPNDPANHHWREYQAWLAKGNKPLPAEGSDQVQDKIEEAPVKKTRRKKKTKE